jgi:SM-20-related protein
MIDLTQIASHTLQPQPYAWTEISNLFSPTDAATLAASFPRDHFKTVVGYDGEKDYEYEARALVAMGANAISHSEQLSQAWLSLVHDLLSPAYRIAMSSLTGCDLTTVPMEVNVFHYGPGARLGPHADLKDKIVTHVLYFNRSWNGDDGGCLTILRSADPTDIAAEIAPIVSNSAVLVRSEKSWHAVSRVINGCRLTRRSLTVTFYRPGSVSTMWPPGDTTPLHWYNATDLEIKTSRHMNLWRRWRGFAKKVGMKRKIL